MAPPRPLKIFVSLPSATYVQRRRFEGLLAYAHEKVRPRWLIQFFAGRAPSSASEADGIIAFLEKPAERAAYLRLGKPTVFVQPDFTPCQDPPRRHRTATVVVDSSSEGLTAARHFLERGYRSFAYVGSPEPTIWSRNRLHAFSQTLTKAGFSCAVFPRSGNLGDWLVRLPSKTAVFCANDRRAREVIAVATDQNRDVPHDLAVLGVDNDQLLCETVTPALSSIPTAATEDGRDAGVALEALMSGQSTSSVIRRQHTQIVARLSTAADVLDDPFLSRALGKIRANPTAKHTIRALARTAGCSEKTLVNHALAQLGHSLAAEIRQLRLDAAVERLRNTDLPVAQIAEECGFYDASHLAMRLRETRGITPLALRRAQTVVV